MAETFYITVKVDAPSLEAANRAVGDAIDHFITNPERDRGVTFRATWPHINPTIDKPEVDRMIQDLRMAHFCADDARLTICDRAAELLERIRG